MEANITCRPKLPLHILSCSRAIIQLILTVMHNEWVIRIELCVTESSVLANKRFFNMA